MALLVTQRTYFLTVCRRQQRSETQLRWPLVYDHSSHSKDVKNALRHANARLFSLSSSSSDSSKAALSVAVEDPPSKNCGTVIGAWVFCRHGDRSPGRPLCPVHRQDEEAHFWLTKLPSPSTAMAYKEFCSSFPPLIDDPSGHFMDVHRNPNGFLTHKGLLQMQEKGRLLRERYDPSFRRSSSSSSTLTGHDNKNTDSDNQFLKQWRISAYSTNYLRTVLSVQSLLDGLLNTKLYLPEETRDDKDYTKLRAKEWPVPDHNFIPTPNYDTDSDDEDEEDDDDLKNNVKQIYLSSNRTNKQERRRPKVFVRVRDQSCDNLNAFDRNPDLMRDLVGDVMQSSSFQITDAKAAPVAARLANILPGLARKGRKDFSASTPSGINWVEAADHFICRTSHNVPLAKYSDFEHDDGAEQILSSMTYKALGHLAWRFRKWYNNPQLLAAIAAPPLREIAQQLEHLVRKSSSIQALQDPDGNFLCVYSCHDVTILSLLYALGADFLADEESATWREYWPAYASTLVIELVRLDKEDVIDPGQKAQGPISDDNRHVVRVLLNDKVVVSTDFLLSKFERDKKKAAGMKDTLTPPAEPLGSGPHNLLTTNEFWKIVTDLESQGDYDFSQWPAMKEQGSFNKGNMGRPRTGSLNSSLN